MNNGHYQTNDLVKKKKTKPSIVVELKFQKEQIKQEYI